MEVTSQPDRKRRRTRAVTPRKGLNSQPGQGLVAEPDPQRAGLRQSQPDNLGGERMAAKGPSAQGTVRDSWLAVLDGYRVQFLILDKELDSTLMSLVRSQPGWTVDFENEVSVLFSRSPAGGI